jgi:hypothetical protein
MKPPFETLTTEDLETASGGGGKAYQFIHESVTGPDTCLRTADRVGRSYGLNLVGSGTERSFVNSAGEHAGNAYWQGANRFDGGDCNIYVN